MTVRDVLRKVLDDDEFKYQLINTSVNYVKATKDGEAEVTFRTDAFTPSQFNKEQEPVGLILWIPREWL